MSKENYKFITVNGSKVTLCPDCDVPTDDPTFPSYERLEYDGAEKDLELISQIYSGDVGCLLPQWNKEEDKQYKARVNRTLFQNFFKSAVRGFPGFLNELSGTENLYKGIVDNIKDVDLRGNGLATFLWQADLNVIRDGYCGILVDCPKHPEDDEGNPLKVTLANQSNFASIRPYLVLIERRNILSWSDNNGLTRITIREYVTEDVGNFGSQVVTRYRTFFNDGQYLLQVIATKDDTPYVVTIDSGVNALGKIPLVLYSNTDLNPLQSVPPLLNLAQKNKAYYELYSEYRHIIFLLNHPVPVRVGLISPGDSNNDHVQPMYLGGSSGMDLPMGGSFSYQEPTGKSLEADRTELDKLETSMNQDTLSFLSSEGDKTATEVNLSSSQTASTLLGLSVLKESMIEQVAKIWAGYYGQEFQGGSCSVNRDLLNFPLSSDDMRVLSTMATEDHLSVITLLEIMSEGKRLPKGITPALEVKRISAQVTLKAKQQSKITLNPVNVKIKENVK